LDAICCSGWTGGSCRHDVEYNRIMMSTASDLVAFSAIVLRVHSSRMMVVFHMSKSVI
jgi:hypothetical protein